MIPRREFSKDTKRAALERSKGICECHRMPWIFPVACGLKHGHGNRFFEHIDPDGAGGSNEIGNCAVLTKTCWKKKTDTHDKPLVAKVVRQKDFNDRTETKTSRPMPCGRSSPYKRPLGSRRPVWRDSGRPVT